MHRLSQHLWRFVRAVTKSPEQRALKPLAAMHASGPLHTFATLTALPPAQQASQVSRIIMSYEVITTCMRTMQRLLTSPDSESPSPMHGRHSALYPCMQRLVRPCRGTSSLQAKQAHGPAGEPEQSIPESPGDRERPPSHSG